MDGTAVDFNGQGTTPPALYASASPAQADPLDVLRRMIETGDTKTFRNMMTKGVFRGLGISPESLANASSRRFDPATPGSGNLMTDIANTLGVSEEDLQKFAKKVETDFRIRALAAGANSSPADGKYNPVPSANILNKLLKKTAPDENGVTVHKGPANIVATLAQNSPPPAMPKRDTPPGISFSACIDGTELSGNITGNFNAKNITPETVSAAAQTALENLGKSPTDRFSLADWDRVRESLEKSLGTPIKDINGIAVQGPPCGL